MRHLLTGLPKATSIATRFRRAPPHAAAIRPQHGSRAAPAAAQRETGHARVALHARFPALAAALWLRVGSVSRGQTTTPTRAPASGTTGAARAGGAGRRCPPAEARSLQWWCRLCLSALTAPSSQPIPRFLPRTSIQPPRRDWGHVQNEGRKYETDF